MTDIDRSPKRIRTSSSSVEDSLNHCRQQARQILNTSSDVSVSDLRAYVLKIREVASESAEKLEKVKKRESDLFHGLTHQEKSISRLESYIKNVEETTAQQASEIRASSMDPFLNVRFQELNQKLAGQKRLLKKAKEELKKLEHTEFSVLGLQLLGRRKEFEKENKDQTKEMAEGKMATLEYELSAHEIIADHLSQAALESGEFQDKIFDSVFESVESVVDKLKERKSNLVQEQSRWAQKKEIWEKQRVDWEHERKIWAEKRASWAGKPKSKSSDKDHSEKEKKAKDRRSKDGAEKVELVQSGEQASSSSSSSSSHHSSCKHDKHRDDKHKREPSTASPEKRTSRSKKRSRDSRDSKASQELEEKLSETHVQ